MNSSTFSVLPFSLSCIYSLLFRVVCLRGYITSSFLSLSSCGLPPRLHSLSLPLSHSLAIYLRGYALSFCFCISGRQHSRSSSSKGTWNRRIRAAIRASIPRATFAPSLSTPSPSPTALSPTLPTTPSSTHPIFLLSAFTNLSPLSSVKFICVPPPSSSSLLSGRLDIFSNLMTN